MNKPPKVLSGYDLAALHTAIHSVLYYQGGHYHSSIYGTCLSSYSCRDLIKWGYLKKAFIDRVEKAEHFEITDAGRDAYNRDMEIIWSRAEAPINSEGIKHLKKIMEQYPATPAQEQEGKQ